MKSVTIYTDGACSGNPGPGGWAAILEYSGSEKEITGYVMQTTNNRMELIAAIKALEALKEPCVVALYSDSSYLINAFAKKWLYSWERNGWMKSDKSSVLNDDLWRLLLELSRMHSVQWIKVRGHSDNEKNERCDALARAEIKAHAKGKKG